MKSACFWRRFHFFLFFFFFGGDKEKQRVDEALQRRGDAFTRDSVYCSVCEGQIKTLETERSGPLGDSRRRDTTFCFATCSIPMCMYMYILTVKSKPTPKLRIYSLIIAQENNNNNCIQASCRNYYHTYCL